MFIFECDVLQVVDWLVCVEGEENKIVFCGGELDDSDVDGMVFVCGGWYNFKFMLFCSIL